MAFKSLLLLPWSGEPHERIRACAALRKAIKMKFITLPQGQDEAGFLNSLRSGENTIPPDRVLATVYDLVRRHHLNIAKGKAHAAEVAEAAKPIKQRMAEAVEACKAADAELNRLAKIKAEELTKKHAEQLEKDRAEALEKARKAQEEREEAMREWDAGAAQREIERQQEERRKKLQTEKKEAQRASHVAVVRHSVERILSDADPLTDQLKAISQAKTITTLAERKLLRKAFDEAIERLKFQKSKL
jgi:hypothetical protein